MSFTTDIEAIVEILGMGQCLFFGICVFMARKRNPANVFLAAFMFAFVISYLDGFLSSVGAPEPFDRVFWPADYLLPPLIYLYVVDLIAPEPKPEGRRWLLHLIPFGIAILLLMPYLTLPEPLLDARLELGWVSWEPREGEGARLNGETAPLQLLAAFFGLILFAHLSLLQISIYIFAIVLAYWRYRRRIKDIYSNIERMTLKWLGFIAGLFLAIWLVVVPIDLFDFHIGDVPDQVYFATMVAQLIAIYALGVVGLRQPLVFDVSGARTLATLSGTSTETTGAADDLTESPRNSGRRKYARSALSEDDAKRIAGKLDAAMIEARLYLDSDLTLPMVAERTGISVNNMSQTINQHLGRNFFDVVNGYRVEEAKRLLATTDDSILDIALAVGFNAKSTFNAAFKKAVGDTPSRYRIETRAHSAPADGDQPAGTAIGSRSGRPAL